MEIRQYDIWLADLNPRMGSESGKIRPVLIIQTDLLNRIGHPSTIVLPITSNVVRDSEILRIHIKEKEAGLEKESDIMLDQIKAIDNKRLTKRLGSISAEKIIELKKNLRVVLDI